MIPAWRIMSTPFPPLRPAPWQIGIKTEALRCFPLNRFWVLRKTVPRRRRRFEKKNEQHKKSNIIKRKSTKWDPVNQFNQREKSDEQHMRRRNYHTAAGDPYSTDWLLSHVYHFSNCSFASVQGHTRTHTRLQCVLGWVPSCSNVNIFHKQNGWYRFKGGGKFKQNSIEERQNTLSTRVSLVELPTSGSEKRSRVLIRLRSR